MRRYKNSTCCFCTGCCNGGRESLFCYLKLNVTRTSASLRNDAEQRLSIDDTIVPLCNAVNRKADIMEEMEKNPPVEIVNVSLSRDIIDNQIAKVQFKNTSDYVIKEIKFGIF